jgi:hypothetical protein
MSQIFIQIPDKYILFNFLKIICKHNNDYYIIDKSTFKLAIYNDIINNFYNDLLPYYHKCKLFYLTRKYNYKNFLTIIRQLCNCLNIKFLYYNIFNNSNYEIVYKIYKNI